MSEEQTPYNAQAHHQRGMSRWLALGQCPWFTGREGGQGKYADAGTDAHSVLAAAVGNGTPPLPADTPNYEAVEWAYHTANDIAIEYSGQWDIEQTITINAPSSPNAHGVFGTPDFAMFCYNRIVIADFKTFGTGEKCHVEQLAGYAYALATNYGYGIRDDALPDNMLCDLYTLHGATKKVELVTMTLAECRDLAHRILDTAALCEGAPGQSSTPPPCANDYCQYCAHYPCEATKRMAEAIAPVKRLNLVTATREKMMERPQDIPAMLVFIGELKNLVAFAKETAKEVIKAHGVCKEDAQGRKAWTLEDDTTGVAWEVRQSPGGRTLRDLQAVWDGYATNHISQEQFLAVCTANIGDLTKAIHTASGLPMKEINAAIGQYAERGDTIEVMRRAK